MREKGNDGLRDPREVFGEDAQDKRDDRHYYCNLILSSVASFLVGAILLAFYKALGLGGLFIGSLLCLLSGYLGTKF